MDILFFVNSALLGVGLAMDAFSVSISNGIRETGMKRGRMCAVAGVYAFFQFAMPMIGWICVHTIVEYFQAFEKFIPWIALILLAYIGGKMIFESVRGNGQNDESEDFVRLSFATLMIQGVATSIDALSVGFTIADYGTSSAVIASLIIALVTFAICMVGLRIGKKVGEKLVDKAGIVGGVILILIGLEIFIKGIFF